MSRDEKIIQAFPPKELPECPVDEARPKWGYCDHGRITLVEHDRAVLCQDCGRSLDPFQYLLDGARAIRRGWADHRHAVQLIKEKREQLETLEKERKRLAAQVKRMKDKTVGYVLDVRKPL